MEQVTNLDNLDSLLGNLQNQKDVTRFKNLVESLYIYCMRLNVNQSKFAESGLESDINSLKHLEKISLYLFSEYKNLLKDHDEQLINNAMGLCALSFEKLGDYLEYVDYDGLTKLNTEQVLLKQLRVYWNSSIAYSLSNNSPNSYVISKKLSNVLERLIGLDALSQEKIDLYYFSYFILSRNFINNIESYIEDPKLKNIFTNLKEFIRNGNEELINNSIDGLKRYVGQKLYTYKTDDYRHLKYIMYVIENIKLNSVWTNLRDIFSKEYILQLIKSNPSVIELWQNQLQVVDNPNGYLRNDDIKRTLINFPTSGGKSLLAEFAIVKELEADNSKKCFYIVPTNALVYEVTKRLRQRFRRLGYNVTSSLSGFEPDFLDTFHENNNVIVTTPEKLDTIIRNNLSDDILSCTSLIVFDEFHKIQDKQRGWLIEGGITFLINHEVYSNIKLVFLSAIMDNGQAILDWVDNTNLASDYVPSEWKPTITLKGIADIDYKKDERGSWISLPREHELYKDEFKNYLAQASVRYLIDGKERRLRLFEFPRYHDSETNKLDKSVNIKRENLIMAVAQKFKNVGGSLIFFHTKEDCENFVRDYEPFFPEKHKVSKEIEFLGKYIEKRLGKDHLLTIGLSKGIVYHHGSLPIDIREAIEDYYIKGFIKIIVCTTTLVEGVNFPIQNFIHSGRKYPRQKTIDAGDFKNIAGRAGRAYQSTYGQIIHVNYYNNLIEEHLNFEDTSNVVVSSLLEDKEFMEILNELGEVAEEDFDDFLYTLSKEPFIKSLLLFYNSLSEEIEDVVRFVENSLFSKQIEQDKMDSIKELSKKMYYFYNKQSKKELIRIQESGLSFKSFDIVKSLSIKIIDTLKDNKDVHSINQIITEEMYLQIISLDECRKYEVRKTTATSRIIKVDDYNLLIDWVESDKSISELSNLYFGQVDEKYRMMRVVEYIKNMFEFKLPWVFGTLSKLIIDDIDNEYIKHLSSFVKYGVNQVIEVDLFKIGMNSRETVKDISNYLLQNTPVKSMDEMKGYLKKIDPLVFLDEGKGLTSFEVRKLVSLTNNFKEITSMFDNSNSVDTFIAGTKYYFCQLKERDLLLDEIESGAHLILNRETTNYYDENAVEIYYKEFKLGYISRDINEEVAYYMDLNSDYELTVERINVIDINNYIEIKVKLSFRNS